MTERCLDLERTIRKVPKGHSVFDPELRNLRADLQDACRLALVTDFKNAQKANLESVLWKHVFYKPIEEFRHRLAKPESQAIKEKTRSAFLKFLEQGVVFYTELSNALKALPPPQQSSGNEAVVASVDVRPSVSRCLICIGDLERYASTSSATATGGSSSAPQQPDLETARKAYAAAAAVFPENGNAYNQLAVLSSLDGNNLASAYFYLRAYFAPRPFTVARANLALLFEQARAAALQLSGGPAGGPRRGSTVKGSRPQAALEKDLAVRHLAVLGPLFLHIDIDTTPKNLAAASKDFDEFLNRLRQQATGGGGGGGSRRGGGGTANALKGGGGGGGALLAGTTAQDTSSMSILESVLASPPHHLVMMTACLLLLVHSCAGNDLPTAATRAYTCSALFDLGARLAGVASKVQLCDARTARLRANAAASPLFSPLRILLRWLVVNQARPALPTVNTSEGSDDIHAVGDVLGTSVLSTRIDLWKALGELAASLQVVASSGAFDKSLPATTAAASSTKRKIKLLEDMQLQAFTPLINTALSLDTRSLEGGGHESQEADPRGVPAEELPPAGSADASCVYRLKCIWEDLSSLAALAASWHAANGTDTQVHDTELVDAVSAFIKAAGGAQGNEAGEEGDLGGTASVVRSVQHQQEQQQQEEQEQQEQEQEQQYEIEEEEMILFAPQQGRLTPPRSRSATPALAHSTGGGAGGGGGGTPASAPVVGTVAQPPPTSVLPASSLPQPPASVLQPSAPVQEEDEEMEDADLAATRMVHEIAAQVLSPEPDAQGRLPFFNLVHPLDTVLPISTTTAHAVRQVGVGVQEGFLGAVPGVAPGITHGIAPPQQLPGGGLFEQSTPPLQPPQNPSPLFPSSGFLGYAPGMQEQQQLYAPLSGEQRPAEGLRSLLFGDGHFGPASGAGWAGQGGGNQGS